MPTISVPTIGSDWLRQPSTDRPAYSCPECGEAAMQFFCQLPETPQYPPRTNSFVCFACGRSWEV
ncbi:MAG: hypothetical protein HY000_38280 [Planctomycetes bacterium]|nr:hypothetical protein [Planctomycetota bacterium]